MEPWKEENSKLEAVFTFADFSDALIFVNRVGELAEEHNHHPDICVKDYNTVTISMTTHDKGSVVTDKDRQLSAAINSLLA